MLRKIKILLLCCLLSSGIYAQVGIATTTLSLTVPTRTATNTLITDTTTSTLVNSLSVDGNLRIADVPLALVVTKTQKEVQKVVAGALVYENKTVTEEILDIKDYKDVLVSDPNGVINHIDINNFYAFNPHYTRYLVVTATYEIDGHITNEILEGSIISIGWLDFCVQYMNDLPAPALGFSGKYLEVKFRPNRKNIKNGIQQNFFFTTNIYNRDLGGMAYERTFVNPENPNTTLSGRIGNMKEWFRFGKGGSVDFARMDRTDLDSGDNAKVIRNVFFNDKFEEWYMIDVYMSIHLNPIDNSRYISVTYWVGTPIAKI